nr:bifunctional phosphoserine phosphatase/homoserine phosphotransferase ThrH [Thauera sp. SWB20]
MATSSASATRKRLRTKSCCSQPQWRSWTYMPGRSRVTGMSLITLSRRCFLHALLQADEGRVTACARGRRVRSRRARFSGAALDVGGRLLESGLSPTCLQESAVRIVCLDLEGVLVPEIWIEFAERTGIPELRRTTRDEPNYDTLMKYRLDILAHKKLGLPDIQDVIASMGPMQGARAFLDDLRDTYQVVILSDTFYEFAKPLMKQLGMPTLFCHSLEADAEGILVNYHLRMPDQKREAVKRFKELNFKVVAAGDSYNDTAMLGEAHGGILFHPPENVVREFPQYPVVRDYDALRAEIDKAFARV